METKFQTSFVPKRPVVANQPTYETKGGPSIFSLIATVIFLGTVLFALGLYGLIFITERDIKNLDKSILERWETFQPDLVKNASRLDDRIESVKKILNNHVSPSRVFGLLELTTLKQVSFSNFSISRDDKSNILLEGDGVAKSPQAIVLQSDEYGNTGKMKSVLFSNVAINEKSLTSFKFESVLDKDFILFVSSFRGNEQNTQKATSTNNQPTNNKPSTATSTNI